MDALKRQPILAIGGGVSAFVLAGIALVNAFWPGTITDTQRDALVGFVVLMWPVLLTIWTQVTPARAPKLPEGKAVLLSDGTDGVVTKA